MLYYRKIRSDNGPGYSHKEYTRELNYYGNKANDSEDVTRLDLSLEERAAVEKSALSTSRPDAVWNDNKIHNPGSGYCAGEWIQVV